MCWQQEVVLDQVTFPWGPGAALGGDPGTTFLPVWIPRPLHLQEACRTLTLAVRDDHLALYMSSTTANWWLSRSWSAAPSSAVQSRRRSGPTAAPTAWRWASLSVISLRRAASFAPVSLSALPISSIAICAGFFACGALVVGGPHVHLELGREGLLVASSGILPLTQLSSLVLEALNTGAQGWDPVNSRCSMRAGSSRAHEGAPPQLSGQGQILLAQRLIAVHHIQSGHFVVNGCVPKDLPGPAGSRARSHGSCGLRDRICAGNLPPRATEESTRAQAARPAVPGA